jgi:hypothetical protein
MPDQEAAAARGAVLPGTVSQAVDDGGHVLHQHLQVVGSDSWGGREGGREGRREVEEGL